MNHRLTELALLAALIQLLPAAADSQMPPQLGRLVVSSEPAGAVVSINGKSVAQRTNATFLVSLGSYSISVSSPDSSLKCTGTFPVSGGQTVSCDCSANGWR